jgi:uncharacterized membrane protein YphA (DoxX/SURF4 family)
MFILTAIVSTLLAVILLVSAGGKLAKNPGIMEVMATVHFPESRLWLLASAELIGAAGLLVGLFYWPIGIAAAVGVIAYFIGAVAAHLRVGDEKFTAAAILLLVGVAVLVLRLLTA